METIFNNNFPFGNPAIQPDQVKNHYTCDIYQGDKSDVQFMNSCGIAANTWVPTGSICYVDANNLATVDANIGKVSSGNAKVPCIVKVGTDKKTTQAEKYNAAGGVVTVLPLTGYFRLVTTVFEQGSSIEYHTGDLLTVGSFTFDGQTVYGIKKASSASDPIVGICDAPVSIDVKRNPAIKFTACFKPVYA